MNNNDLPKPSPNNFKSDMEFVLSSYKASLNRISDEIRLHEEKLGKANLSFTFIYVISANNQNKSNECLVYEKCEGSRSLLCYNIYQNLNEFRHEIGKESLLLLSTENLIDSPPQFRIKIAKELPIFYLKSLEASKIQTNQKVIIEYSPAIPAD
jgi:hypothetical protein